jgi:hypothetical protein
MHTRIVHAHVMHTRVVHAHDVCRCTRASRIRLRIRVKGMPRIYGSGFRHRVGFALAPSHASWVAVPGQAYEWASGSDHVRICRGAYCKAHDGDEQRSGSAQPCNVMTSEGSAVTETPKDERTTIEMSVEQLQHGEVFGGEGNMEMLQQGLTTELRSQGGRRRAEGQGWGLSKTCRYAFALLVLGIRVLCRHRCVPDRVWLQ